MKMYKFPQSFGEKAAEDKGNFINNIKEDEFEKESTEEEFSIKLQQNKKGKSKKLSPLRLNIKAMASKIMKF